MKRLLLSAERPPVDVLCVVDCAGSGRHPKCALVVLLVELPGHGRLLVSWGASGVLCSPAPVCLVGSAV